jgi:hypothetical protein
MAKRARELAVKEKRERKKARKDAQRDNPTDGTATEPVDTRPNLNDPQVGA